MCIENVGLNYQTNFDEEDRHGIFRPVYSDVAKYIKETNPGPEVTLTTVYTTLGLTSGLSHGTGISVEGLSIEFVEGNPQAPHGGLGC